MECRRTFGIRLRIHAMPVHAASMAVAVRIPTERSTSDHAGWPEERPDLGLLAGKAQVDNGNGLSNDLSRETCAHSLLSSTRYGQWSPLRAVTTCWWSPLHAAIAWQSSWALHVRVATVTRGGGQVPGTTVTNDQRDVCGGTARRSSTTSTRRST